MRDLKCDKNIFGLILVKKTTFFSVIPRAVIVAQLAEQLLPVPEVCNSNAGIDNCLNIIYLFTVNYIEKIKIKKEKRPGMAHFKKL